MKRQAFFVAIGIILGSATRLPAGEGEPSPGSVARLGWLAGCWQRASEDRQTVEQWMAPLGGTMLGMSRTVVEGKTREYEHLRIHEDGPELIYTAIPSGQRETSFRSTEVGPTRAVFENPAHDFPQRIIYQLQGDGSLVARIEGEREGKTHGVDFPYQRVACPGGH